MIEIDELIENMKKDIENARINGNNNIGEIIVSFYAELRTAMNCYDYEEKKQHFFNELQVFLLGEDGLSQEANNQFFTICMDMMKECPNDINYRMKVSIRSFLFDVLNRVDLENIHSKFDIFLKFFFEDEKFKNDGLYNKFSSGLELDNDKKEILFEHLLEHYHDYDLNDKGYVALSSFFWLANDDVQCLKKIFLKLEEIKETDIKRYYTILYSLKEKHITDNFLQAIRESAIGKDKIEFYGKFFYKSDDKNRGDKLDEIIGWIKEDGLDKELDLSDEDSYIKCLFFTELNLETWNKSEDFDMKNYIINFFLKYLKKEKEKALLDGKVYNFLNALKTKNLSNEGIENLDELKKLFEELKEKTKIPENIQEFDKLLKQTGEISEDRINEFLQTVRLFRIKNDNLPKKYYDFIIKQLVLGKIDENNPIVFDVLQELTKDYLSELGINDCPVSCISCKTDNFLLGGFDPKRRNINISDNYMFLEGLVNIQDVIFHEANHAKQFKQMEEPDLYNPEVYIMIKEYIIMNKNFWFYRNNYEKMEVEFDARMNGILGMYKYLLSIGLSVEDIVKFEDVRLVSEIGKWLTKDRRFKKEKERDTSEKHIDEFFLQHMKSLSEEEIKELFAKYPILKTEFELSADGTFVKKSREQIEAERDELLRNTTDESKKTEIQRFYEQMLKEKTRQEYGTSREDYIQFLKDNGYSVDDSIIALLDAELRTLKNKENARNDIQTQPNNAAQTQDDNVIDGSNSLKFARICYSKHSAIERHITTKKIGKYYLKSKLPTKIKSTDDTRTIAD